MSQILVVEDSRLFGSVIQQEVESRLPEFKVYWVETYAEAEALLDEQQNNFFIGLLDLNLPDAPHGEIVDLVLDRKISAIVFTGDINDEVRDRIWTKNVADYVLKEGEQSIEYIISLINRLKRNQDIQVLVVDDSQFSRKVICDLLHVHKYSIFEAADGIEALEILKENDQIKMVITDYNMPNMDGFELTKEIRGKFGRDELTIIGLSGEGSSNLSARFIKYGANDFINKPFLQEEFYCRISQAIEMLENINKIKDLSNKDFLTGLYNRRFLFDSGNKLFASTKRALSTTTVAMLDIDYFKKINDTYGHYAGDLVLQQLAKLLQNRFRKNDIISRFGGEEFCLLLTSMEHKYIPKIFEELREKIAQEEFQFQKKTISFTVSIGICTKLHPTLEDMIDEADILLYQAKEAGRNRVIIDFQS